MLSSKEVPQADVLHDVIRTVRFVQQNKGSTYSMIARHIKKGDRQGRYYRHAAQLLGLIDNRNNYAWILPTGDYSLSLAGQEQMIYLRKLIKTLRVFQLTEDLLRTKPGCTEKDVYKLLYDNGDNG
ncbi:hypothetical protein FOI68_21380 [Brevibacillus sp. LEMMJ03]|uniref:hypothetical protein n=1 Tax=Brevibacillus sp. LEMMJ03 TaxID=2595056 RepID=UPI00117DDF92|nr:hypothetical protein [Brevibacillus sp. LEMMJ03]TRY23339.1 hypothetical protein FOI68_21380 [Brevibacillus sp. LEMMJ03]